MNEEHQRRVAKNEALWRGVNEGIEQAVERFGLEGRQEFACECGDANCTERIPLTPSEFAALRANPRRFAIVPGHEIPEVERVVAPNAGFTVVEKTGPAAEVVDRQAERRGPDYDPPSR